MKEQEHLWHRETVGAQVEEALLDLQGIQVLSRFYLAGGTGLALHLGHRRSVDLDFFSGQAFDEAALLQKIQNLAEFSLAAKQPGTIHAQIRRVKVSFLTYTYPVLFPFETFLGVNVADPRDIACMKVSAIASRGAKRDFVDLYTVSQQHGLGQILGWFANKFARANYSKVHVLKSLTYFEEAEQDPMPDMLATLNWQEVKRFFLAEAPRLL
ncbi:MAG TPA: nucleotidyl transferase AbiEii/AbiGii toxin family protein [Terriglobia bacterium]|nr:nucleotidyl transferase AbiEii/AbiGii toxin family protein [Terriglobia bacterium]